MKNITVLTALLLLFSCNYKASDTQTLCVDEGKHSFKPYKFSWDDNTHYQFEWKFSSDMQYNHNSPDQKDWNKLFGVSPHLFTNHENSMMIAWRWNMDGYWEIAPYYHKNGGTFYAEKDSNIPVLAVWPGSNFETTIAILDAQKERVAVTITAPVGHVYFEKEFGEAFDNLRIINPFFGGNLPAPHKMCVNQKLLIVK